MTPQELYDLAAELGYFEVANFIAQSDSAVIPVGQSPASMKQDYYEDATYA